MNEDKQAVRGFLSTLCNVDALGDDDDIFATGFVNSLYLVQLLQFVQRHFAVVIEEDDYDMANFRSIEAIAAFVARKRAA